MAELDSAAAPPEFRIGLAMAGAISAGAYTAGVMDFLFQALSEWEAGGTAALAETVDDPAVAAERADYRHAPAHRVKIAALSGASAGGMTAAITAAVAGAAVDPVTVVPPPGSVNNRFYESWVQKIDIEHFLNDDDLKAKSAQVVSLLDSSILEVIAEDAINVSGPAPPRAFVADPLPVFLTVANLRGVPYEIGIEGAGALGHGMTMHADYMEFCVAARESDAPRSAEWLNPADYADPRWRLLAESALASGAFPGGLAPRKLGRPAGHYAERMWEVPGEDGTTYQSIDPAWRFSEAERYEFMNVDGGLMNNEPLELARRALRRAGEGPRNSRDGGKADRAVIMVDPFPSPGFDPDRQVAPELVSVLKAMFASLKAQARFKPDELALAAAPGVYSRFMISPTRTAPEASAPEAHPIASGSFGGFGGFLSQGFREHDFNLGRRNCQRFLQRHFVLPRDNRLFEEWPEALKAAMARPHPSAQSVGNDHLPVVPLVGSAQVPVPWMGWPSMTEEELGKIADRVGRRARAVVKALVREHVHPWAATPVWWAFGGKTRDRVMGTIRDSLNEFGLLR